MTPPDFQQCATECGLSKTTQNRIVACKNSAGEDVEETLCTDVKPSETKDCEATTACELDDKVYCDKYTLCPTGTLKAAAATIEGATNDLCCDTAPASLTCALNFTKSNCSGTLSEYNASGNCSGTECTNEECCKEEEDNTMIIIIVVIGIIFCCILPLLWVILN
jgi:hypothetical protein